MKRIIGLAVLAISLTHCGNNAPLTDAQRAQFKETLTSVGRSQEAVRGRDGAKATNDADLGRMSERLGQCDIKMSEPKKSPSMSDLNMDLGMTVAGNSCPVSMNVALKISQKVSQDGNLMTLKIDMKMKYSVKDPEFKKLNDITGFDIAGNGSVEVTKGSAKGNLNADGTIESQKDGKISFFSNLKADAHDNSGTMEQVLGIRYSTHTAELKKVTTIKKGEKSLEKYTLNGVEVTEKEFNDYVQSAGLLGSATNGLNQSSSY